MPSRSTGRGGQTHDTPEIGLKRWNSPPDDATIKFIARERGWLREDV